MRYFLNSVIIALSLVIVIFIWSISQTILSKKPINYIENISTKQTTKNKLFENYDNQTLKVGILNGCGISGLGNQFAEILSNKYGLDIISTKNADNFDYEETTVVIINESNPNIENILTILGMTINDNNVEFNSSYNTQEDIQIIIGKNYSDFLNLN
jgi:hypothetical protein